MIRATMLVVVTAGMLVLPISGAVASPADDAREVFADWRPDGDITSCRFTRQQLSNSLAVLGGVDLNYYAPGFREEVGREIARHDSGGCRGITPDTSGSAGARARSALRRLRIVSIRPRGGSRESVTIRNPGSTGVSLKGSTLRDRSGRRIKLGSKRLGARRSLRVYTGCAKGRKKAYRRGSRLYACSKRRVWDDRGDVVRIVDRRGVAVAQRGYGRFRRVFRF
jgi:hypothetical protein